MRFDTGQHLRMDQRMKLAPRMIQSMEILQMSTQALEERLEQELASNPTLELRDASADPDRVEADKQQTERDAKEGERELVVSDDTAGGDKSHVDDFERLSNFTDENADTWASNTSVTGDDEDRSYRVTRNDGERDRKLDALANTISRPLSLGDQLLEQWVIAEFPELENPSASTHAAPASNGAAASEPPITIDLKEIRRAGEFIIGFIDDDGYLRTEMEALLQQAPPGMTQPLLERALELLQRSLEPVGMAARDLRECLLLQIDARIRALQSAAAHAAYISAAAAQSHNYKRNGRHGNASKSHNNPQAEAERSETGSASGSPGATPAPPPATDFTLERTLVSDHLKDIEVNRLPKIAQATGHTLDEIKQAITNLRQFNPRPGRLLVDDRPRSITPDAIVEFDEEEDRYIARLFHGRLPSVYINPRYLKMVKDAGVERKTRDFVGQNLRSARWLLDAIRQRDHTLLRVLNVVLEAQRDFFDLGPQALKPLPMTQVADQLGIHVATVSRAVSEKYIQSPRGIFPLRMFFTSGIETQSGESLSAAAIQSKLQDLVNGEDKANPLSDDELAEKLSAGGIEIARRTVAKYRKQLKIATARQRRVF